MSSPNAFVNSPVTDAVVVFLKRIPMFQALPREELHAITGAMSLEYFPKGQVILTAGSRASDYLYIIQKGGVKLTVSTEAGSEVILDMRAEGELFGLLSMVGGDVTRLDVKALEDTLCYTLPSDQVKNLLARHPEISAYLLRTSLTRYIDRSLSEIRERTHLLAEGERLLYSLTVEDVAQQRSVMCAPDISVQDAARRMAQSGSTCIFVEDEKGQAVGVVTDNDLTNKVIANGLPLTTPVANIMSGPVLSVECRQSVFLALLSMLSNDIHHLLVTRDGRAESVISNHDLLLLQGKSPLTVVRHIESQQTLDELVSAQVHSAELIPLLMLEGAKASHITQVIAEINDRVVSKILQLAEKEMGPPPVPYCWITLGSEGRREQTFKTDQDNGLIYSDVTGEGRGEAELYFTGLAKYAEAALVRCGFPRCEGGYMASNPRWRQPLQVWKDYFRTWITDPEKNSAGDALIFFDMRPVAGEFTLHGSLAQHVRELLSKAEFFKSIFAYVSMDHKPPMGFFRTIVVQRSGDHKHTFDLKLNGVGPITNAARMFAIDAGIESTNTFDRLLSLEAAGYGEPGLWKELQEALEFLLLFRLEHQLQQTKDGRPINDHVDPAGLSPLHRALLKESFHVSARAQSLIKSKFESWVWAQLG